MEVNKFEEILKKYDEHSKIKNCMEREISINGYLDIEHKKREQFNKGYYSALRDCLILMAE